jgi:hypothetical protein
MHSRKMFKYATFVPFLRNKPNKILLADAFSNKPHLSYLAGKKATWQHCNIRNAIKNLLSAYPKSIFHLRFFQR